jgi:hypothetical protein
MKGDKNYDYTDEFSDIIHTERFISAAELSELFFSAPKWITLLMKFRNVVMRPFGLKKERKLSDLVLIESEIWQRYAKMINILIWKLCL